MRIFSIIVATLLAVYLILAAIFFEQDRHQSVCREVQVVVADSLEKHFVSEGDLAVWLKRAGLNPVGKPLREINTERIEQELLKNEMIAGVEVYKTPSGLIKLVVEQKMPILRVMSVRGNYYVDNKGSVMPLSAGLSA